MPCLGRGRHAGRHGTACYRNRAYTGCAVAGHAGPCLGPCRPGPPVWPPIAVAGGPSPPVWTSLLTPRRPPPNPNRADLPAQQPPPPIPVAHGAATNRRSLSPTTQVNLPNSTQLPNPTTAAEAAAPAAGDRCSAPPSSSQAPASAGRRWPRRSTAVASWLSDSASSPPKVRLLIGGEFVKSRDNEHVDVTNPATQEVMSWIPLTTADEFKASVDAARTAFPGQWNTLVTTRQRIMFKYQELIRANMDKLAENITTE